MSRTWESSHLRLDLFPTEVITDASDTHHRLVWTLSPGDHPLHVQLSYVNKDGVDTAVKTFYAYSEEGLKPAVDSLMAATPTEWSEAADQTFAVVEAAYPGKFRRIPHPDTTINPTDQMTLTLPWVVTHKERLRKKDLETRCRPTFIWNSERGEWRFDVHWVDQDIKMRTMLPEYTAMSSAWKAIMSSDYMETQIARLRNKDEADPSEPAKQTGPLRDLRYLLDHAQHNMREFSKSDEWRSGPSGG